MTLYVLIKIRIDVLYVSKVYIFYNIKFNTKFQMKNAHRTLSLIIFPKINHDLIIFINLFTLK